MILFPSAKNEDSRVKTDTGLAKNAICSIVYAILSKESTQRQNKVKKRINPNQGPNLCHLPREEHVVEL